MSVVKINAISVPRRPTRSWSAASQHERTPSTARRASSASSCSGRSRATTATSSSPTGRTTSRSLAWRDGDARQAHAGERAKPVASGADLLEFEVVLDVRPGQPGS